ncbi:very short patch repair endonuclease [Sphingomonas sp. 7/4-4]|uniref:very short patch repair endonuclease n=1 Tax=Sphingomonas sp. 7/4-4 TaxID=3018446 RepID=UPI0022F3AE19|nr:very short patch repair endonuclease [Sphingomonas sp. 7/4-4]WBY08128.1 very short patch repair endonuclease [Sphingomonas sp. 7/4-4]
MTLPFADVDPLRRRIMSAVRGRDTKPEMIVRRLLHAMNYRFRLHRKDLPGSPDIVFGRRRKAIFVHGCFWHRHPGCSKASTPKKRAEFWAEKFDRNVERDRSAEMALQKAGWKTLVVWECETRFLEPLAKKLKAFLDEPGFRSEATA